MTWEMERRRTDVSKIDAGKYEILYDLPQGEYSAREVGGTTTKTVRAGDSLEVECFPVTHVSDQARREARRRMSTKAQENLNLKNSRKKVRRLMEKNFTAGDLVLHPTFNYGFVDRAFANVEDERKAWEKNGLPMSDDDARRIMRNFIARIRRLIRRKGGNPADFKYIYVIETTKEPRDEDFNALPARYHYHMVISGLGILTAEELGELWSYGYIKAEPLDFRFNGLEGLSKYITKQRRFTRRWARSKNLLEPDETISHRKISRRRAAAIAADVQANAKDIFEKLYPGYTLEEAEVKYSDFVAGAYIYARMRRIQELTRKHMQRRRKE